MKFETFCTNYKNEVESLLKIGVDYRSQIEEEIIRYNQVLDSEKGLEKHMRFLYWLRNRFVLYCRDLELKLSVEEKLNKDKKQIKRFLEGYKGLEGNDSLGELILKSSDNRNPVTLKVNSEVFLYHFKKFLDDNDFSNRLELDYLKQVSPKYKERDFEKGFIKQTLEEVLDYAKSNLENLESKKSRLEFAIVCYYMIGLYTTQDSKNKDAIPLHVSDKYDSIKSIEYYMEKHKLL